MWNTIHLRFQIISPPIFPISFDIIILTWEVFYLILSLWTRVFTCNTILESFKNVAVQDHKILSNSSVCPMVRLDLPSSFLKGGSSNNS